MGMHGIGAILNGTYIHGDTILSGDVRLSVTSISGTTETDHPFYYHTIQLGGSQQQ